MQSFDVQHPKIIKLLYLKYEEKMMNITKIKKLLMLSSEIELLTSVSAVLIVWKARGFALDNFAISPSEVAFPENI